MNTDSLTWLEPIFAEAFRQWQPHAPTPPIHVRYYPFAGLTHTIRRRQGRIYVRLSEVLQNASLEVHRAVAQLLVAKLLKQPAPAHYERLYQRYAEAPLTESAADEAQRRYGSKRLTAAQGEVYDLNAIFARLNRRYFNNALARPRLSWSQRATRRVLGHHDEVHDVIVISCTLDHNDVPPYVIEFVVYHEMLHLKHPSQMVNGRRRYHSTAFRAEEGRFARYDEAMDWIETLEQKQ